MADTKTETTDQAHSKTKQYVLKRGAEHSYIFEGESREVKGDGKLTVPLLPAQYEAFKDKFYADPDEVQEAAEAAAKEDNEGVVTQATDAEGPAQNMPSANKDADKQVGKKEETPADKTDAAKK